MGPGVHRLKAGHIPLSAPPIVAHAVRVIYDDDVPELAPGEKRALEKRSVR